MTLHREKPGGHSDGSDAITARQLNAWDVNLSRAIDGAEGGDYATNGPINIDDGSGGALNNLSIIGLLRFKLGAFLQLLVGTAIADSADLTLDPADGQYREFTAPTANRNHDMVAAGHTGKLLRLTRADAAGFGITIRRSGFAGSYIVLLSNPQSYALLYDDGTNWRLLSHANATPGAHA